MSDDYPIVYTAMPIKLKISDNKSNTQIETICCVPVKSYLVTETKHYLSKDKNEKTYGVVFSWQQKSFENIIEKNTRLFPFEDESNIIEVRTIFNSKAKCIENVNLRNANISRYLNCKYENDLSNLTQILDKQNSIMEYALDKLKSQNIDREK